MCIRDRFDFVCTDLLALRGEGNSWDIDLDSAKGTHATIRRQIKSAAGARRPNFVWVPSHKSLEEYAQMCIPPLFFLGNAWADWFARAGAAEHKVSQVYEDFYMMEYRQHQKVAQYMAWAMRRMLSVGGWDPDQAYVPVRAPVWPQPQLTVVEHQLVRLDTG
eukprot:6974241-Pyramimonas_sp.AAC.1